MDEQKKVNLIILAVPALFVEKTYGEDIETVKELLAILKQTDQMLRLAKQEQDNLYKVYLMKQASAPVKGEHDEEDLPVCRCCKFYGHIVRECPEAECYGCGGIGHISYDCSDRHVDNLRDY